MISPKADRIILHKIPSYGVIYLVVSHLALRCPLPSRPSAPARWWADRPVLLNTINCISQYIHDLFSPNWGFSSFFVTNAQPLAMNYIDGYEWQNWYIQVIFTHSRLMVLSFKKEMPHWSKVHIEIMFYCWTVGDFFV